MDLDRSQGPSTWHARIFLTHLQFSLLLGQKINKSISQTASLAVDKHSTTTRSSDKQEIPAIVYITYSNDAEVYNYSETTYW